MEFSIHSLLMAQSIFIDSAYPNHTVGGSETTGQGYTQR